MCMEMTHASLFTPFPPGWWPHDAAHSLDASREHHVQEVHHRKWRLEPGGGVVGDLHVWQTALVPAVQQRGAQWAEWDPPEGLTLRGACWPKVRTQDKALCGFVGCSTSQMACCMAEGHGWSIVTLETQENHSVYWHTWHPLWWRIAMCCSPSKLIADVTFQHPESPVSFCILFQEGFKVLSILHISLDHALLVKTQAFCFPILILLQICLYLRHSFLVRHLTSSGSSLSFTQICYPKWPLISTALGSLISQHPDMKMA